MLNDAKTRLIFTVAVLAVAIYAIKDNRPKLAILFSFALSLALIKLVTHDANISPTRLFFQSVRKYNLLMYIDRQLPAEEASCGSNRFAYIDVMQLKGTNQQLYHLYGQHGSTAYFNYIRQRIIPALLSTPADFILCIEGMPSLYQQNMARGESKALFDMAKILSIPIFHPFPASQTEKVRRLVMQAMDLSIEDYLSYTMLHHKCHTPTIILRTREKLQTRVDFLNHFLTDKIVLTATLLRRLRNDIFIFSKYKMNTQLSIVMQPSSEEFTLVERILTLSHLKVMIVNYFVEQALQTIIAENPDKHVIYYCGLNHKQTINAVVSDEDRHEDSYALSPQFPTPADNLKEAVANNVVSAWENIQDQLQQSTASESYNTTK